MNPNAIKKNDEIKNNTLQAHENHLWLLKHINPKNKQKNPFPKKNDDGLKLILGLQIFLCFYKKGKKSQKIEMLFNFRYI